MKKLYFFCLLGVISCSVSEDMDQSGEFKSAFIASIQGDWTHSQTAKSFSISSSGDISYQQTSSYFVASLYRAETYSSAIYKVGASSYMGVKVQGDYLYYTKYYTSSKDVIYSNMTKWATRSTSSSSPNVTNPTNTTTPTNTVIPTNDTTYYPDDPSETVPSIYNELFLNNLKKPYAYRDGTFFFKIDNNGDFVSHKVGGGVWYRFYTALSDRKALYRNETKTQFYGVEIDTDGNIRRSAASGTQNTGSTTLFAYRSDERYDDIFLTTLTGRYESKSRFFTIGASGAFRVQDDLYYPSRIISKSEAVYERFGEFYGLRISNGQLYFADSATGVDRTNQSWTNNGYMVQFAQRYTGIASDTPPTFSGSTVRENFFENLSGKSFYAIFSYSGQVNGYFRAADNGNIFWQGTNGANTRYVFSYAVSPTRAVYGATQLVIDPLGDIRVRGARIALYYFTTYDYETAFWKLVSYNKELIYNGESYHLIRIVDSRRAVYQKLANGLYYGVTLSTSGTITGVRGNYTTPESITWSN